MLHEIKNKLIYKAVDKYELLNGDMRSDTDGAAAVPKGSAMYVKEYSECPMAFDSMIISLSQYFDLVSLTSYKLEDLWLNLLDVLDLERPNNYTVFKAVHHQGYRNIILKDPLMQQVIRQTDAFKDSGLACMNPSKYLERIYDIRRNCATAEEPYANFVDSLQSEALR